MKFGEIIARARVLVNIGVGLFYCPIRTGIRDLIWRQVPNSLIINANRNDPDFKKYVEELEKIGKNQTIKNFTNFFLSIIKIISIILLMVIVGLLSVFMPD